MTTWYKTDWSATRVVSVEIELHTASSVWIDGRRHARHSVGACNFFPSEIEAWAFLEKRQEDAISRLKNRLHQHRSRPGKIKAEIDKLPTKD